MQQVLVAGECEMWTGSVSAPCGISQAMEGVGMRGAAIMLVVGVACGGCSGEVAGTIVHPGSAVQGSGRCSQQNDAVGTFVWPWWRV